MFNWLAWRYKSSALGRREAQWTPFTARRRRLDSEHRLEIFATNSTIWRTRSVQLVIVVVIVVVVVLLLLLLPGCSSSTSCFWFSSFLLFLWLKIFATNSAIFRTKLVSLVRTICVTISTWSLTVALVADGRDRIWERSVRYVTELSLRQTNVHTYIHGRSGIYVGSADQNVSIIYLGNMCVSICQSIYSFELSEVHIRTLCTFRCQRNRVLTFRSTITLSAFEVISS